MTNAINWQLVNPTGSMNTAKIFHAGPHPANLNGKTILLRWNGKHNGDVFLGRIAELLHEHIKDARIIKGWEVVPETIEHSYSPARSKTFAGKLAGFRPDLVIGAQAD